MAADDTLLRAYLDGDLDEEALARFEDWLKEDESHLRRLVLASAMEAQLEQLTVDRVGGDVALVEQPEISDELGRELTDAYLRGELAEAEVPRLQRWLQRDVHRMRFLLSESNFEYDLHQQVSARVESGIYEPSTDETPRALRVGGLPLSTRSERRARRRSGRRWPSGAVAWVASTSLMAAAILLWFLAPPRTDRTDGDGTGRVLEPVGSAAPAPAARVGLAARFGGRGLLLERDGAVSRASSVDDLRDGDRLRVMRGGHGRIACADGTALQLAEGTELVWRAQAGITVDLARGTIQVAAATQPGEPMRVRTATATVTVLGTVFVVDDSGGRTRLQVLEGEVELDAHRERMVVTAGGTAVADRGGIDLRPPRSDWLGVELPGIGAPHAELLPFVDLMAYARPWRVRYDSDVPESERAPLAIGSDGWVERLEPGQRANTLILPGRQYPSGVYTCLYDGDGLIQFGHGANIIRTERGRLEVDVTHFPYGISLTILETDPDDPIRNLRLVMPGFEDRHRHDPFNPAFVDSLRGAAVLRSHRWLGAGGEEWLGWADRRRPGDGPGADRAREQVPLEHLFDLANRLGSDLWLCAPHTAEDDWFHGAATLAEQQLDDDRAIYLEYSSEIWNGVHHHVRWCMRQAEELGLPGPSPGIAFSNQRSESLWDAFESATVGSDRELVRVLSSFPSNPAFGSAQRAHGEAFARADALAVYGGIGGGLCDGWSAERVLAADREELLDEVRALTEIALDRVLDHRALAREQGKRVIAWRAGATFWLSNGAGLQSDDPRYTRPVSTIAADPAVGPLLDRWLTTWYRFHGDVAVLSLQGYVGDSLRADTPAVEKWRQVRTGPVERSFQRMLRSRLTPRSR